MTISSNSYSNTFKRGGSLNASASTSATAKGVTTSGAAVYQSANGGSGTVSGSATETAAGAPSGEADYGYTTAAGQSVASGTLDYADGSLSYTTQHLGTGSVPVGNSFDLTA